MTTAQKSKSLAFGVPGLFFQIGCMTLIHFLFPNTGGHSEAPTDWVYLSLSAGVLLGVIFLIVGLSRYATAKGYGPEYGFLGLLSILGVLILVALPDKTKGQSNGSDSAQVASESV
jgi:hypothetical protein